MLVRVQDPPARPAAVPGQGGAISAPELQARLLDLHTRAAALTAQRAVFIDHSRSGDAVIRVSANQSLMNVDVDLASVKAQIASLEAELARLGVSTETAPPPPPPPGPAPMLDPDAVTAVFVMTAIAILVPLSIGLSRRLWRRPMPPVRMLEEKLSPRLDRLEQAVDAIAIEVERISEGQRFVTKVLSERPSAGNAQVSNDAAAIGEGKPFLALGAGPMEPIRMAERQAVKQSVTPH
jgi:hypothetical protein